jgi:hypothetical protein
VDARVDHAFFAPRDIRLAPALEPVVGLDPAKQKIFAGTRMQQKRLYVRNFGQGQSLTIGPGFEQP